MEEDALYKKGLVKITYLHSPEPGEENKIISGEEHELWMRERDGEYNRYILQRGILKELHDAAKNNPQDLSSKLRTINEFILHEADRVGVSLNDLGDAFIEAYQKGEDDF